METYLGFAGFGRGPRAHSSVMLTFIAILTASSTRASSLSPPLLCTRKSCTWRTCAWKDVASIRAAPPARLASLIADANSVTCDADVDGVLSLATGTRAALSALN